MTLNSFEEIFRIIPFGAEDDGAGNSTGNQGGDSNSQGNQGNSNQNQQQNQNGTGSTSTSDDDSDDDPYAGMSSKELKRLLKDAEKASLDGKNAAKALQDKIDAENRKKNDDVTNLTNDLEAERNTNKQLRAALAQQAIQNAIRNDTRFEWKNTEIVAQQLNSEIVKVSDDGKVEGLAKELSRIAKDDSLKFLLAKDNTQQGNQQQQQNQNQQQNGSTGFQPGQGGASSGGGIDPNAKELAELMPALRSRI